MHDSELYSSSRSYYSDRNNLTAYAAERVLRILDDLSLRPESVLDIGCGVGTWAAMAKQKWGATVCGIDGPWVESELLEIASGEFESINLSETAVLPMAGGTSERWDLAVWLENAEHLQPGQGEKVIQNLAKSSKTVLFSAAIPGQGGTGHYNEQWQSYWADLFQDSGFIAVDCVRPEIWVDIGIPAWYRQNILVYVHEKEWPTISDSMGVYVPGETGRLDLVHPELWRKRVLERAAPGVKRASKNLLSAIVRKVTGR